MEIWFMQKTRPRMNYDCIGKTIWKKIQTIKIVKSRVKWPHINKKKSLTRKLIYVQTLFSRTTLKLKQKISRRKTTHFFAPLLVLARPKSLLQFDFKNHKI